MAFEEPKSALKQRARRNKPATLADVAAMAGVVPMTASRALNRSGYVSAGVMERVEAAARQLEYRPNVLARQLRGSRLNAIGILLPDIANPFVAELMKGISPVLHAGGYTGFIATAGRSGEEERHAIQTFIDHRIDGLLVATIATESGDDMLRSISAQGIPIVTIGRKIDLPTVDCVTADHYQGGFDAVTHLVSLGHKLIGFVGSPALEAMRLSRYEGYIAAMIDAGLAPNLAHTVGSEFGPSFATEEDGYTGLISLCKLKNRPTAVFARNDFAAIGALHAAHTLGLRIPEDIAIVGFDNIPMSAYLTPPLTTVEQPMVEQGRLAAEFLLKRIEVNPKRVRQVTQLPCKLIVRASTQPNAKPHTAKAKA